MTGSDVDAAVMAKADAAASAVRHLTSPNPWVGAVVVAAGGDFVGATSPPGGLHAERHALAAAGENARGATLYSTLEPCAHRGRTGPCTEAIIDAGIARVVFALEDPDPAVSGEGRRRLEAAGVDVSVGVGADEARVQLAPYLHHRSTGRPFVVLKWASTLDGRTAAADGSSQWITGEQARIDVHRLRAESDVVVVGAGTVRSDDPALTVRDWQPASGPAVWSDGSRPTSVRQPERVVLGSAPADSRVRPCREWSGSLDDLLDTLGAEGKVQVLVEGGASVAGQFHRSGLVDRYVCYLAPSLLGGDDGLAAFSGPGAATIAHRWRGQLESVERLGEDLRVEVSSRR